ncbi:MAG TPA: vitamin K epoxide reductase family protein [Minicystis sp.]|nr:vitamin K epoxide reductase family protein [Minicystis sp.]
MSSPKRWPPALALGASLLGFAFAMSSTLDYARHLDRQVHDLHCSFVPGLGAEQGADTACRVAMYSPFAALFRTTYWGGIPIALFAVGAFAFFAAFALYLLLVGRAAPRSAAAFYAATGVTPLFVSILMFTISAVRLGHFCKTCVGIYVSSALLAIGAVATYLDARARAVADAEARMRGFGRAAPTVDDDGRGAAPAHDPVWLVPAWLAALGACAVTPALLYSQAVPGYGHYIGSCGKLERPVSAEKPDIQAAMLHIQPPSAREPVTMLVDPLCPTCKAFHQRLVTEGFFDQLDVTLVLFPLDSECNWMLDRSVHPGSCQISRAILCGDHRALAMLEWAYENQEHILEEAKLAAGPNNVRRTIRDRWPGLDVCMDSKETKQRLDKMLRFIVDNHLPISTPQMFLGARRLCDEDTDMGLAYTLKRLAPGLRAK